MKQTYTNLFQTDTTLFKQIQLKSVSQLFAHVSKRVVSVSIVYVVENTYKSFLNRYNSF